MNEGSFISYICRDSSLTLRFLHSHGYHISDYTSFLAVLLNSGLTTCQYIIPLFTVLQGIPILFPPFSYQSYFLLFPKTYACFLVRFDFFTFNEQIRFFLLPQLDLYPLPGRFFSLSFVKFYLSFRFHFLDMSSLFFVFPKHLSESL